MVGMEGGRGGVRVMFRVGGGAGGIIVMRRMRGMGGMIGGREVGGGGGMIIIEGIEEGMWRRGGGVWVR